MYEIFQKWMQLALEGVHGYVCVATLGRGAAPLFVKGHRN